MFEERGENVMQSNYLKITEDGNAFCVATSRFERISDVIGMLSDAISAEENGETLKDAILTRCGDYTDIDTDDWETKARDHAETPNDERIVDLDLDAETAVLSDWKGDGRNVVSGEIWRLAGCYEMAMQDGKLDGDQFVEELMHHCSIHVMEARNDQAFTVMQM